MDSKKKIQSVLSCRIKEARLAKGLTQPELAKLINSTDRNISNYETGYSFPSITVLYNISVVLSTSVDYLFGLTDDPEISVEGKELTSDDLRLINKLKSEEDIYEYLTENTDSAVYYIYEIWKLMDKFKEEK